MLSTRLNELRMQAEMLGYDAKERITTGISKEHGTDERSELEELRCALEMPRANKPDAAQEDKETRKQEKMALVMAQSDAQGAFGKKDEQLDADNAPSALTSDDIASIRRQLAGGRAFVRNTVEYLRQKQAEGDLAVRRRDELDTRLSTLEVGYEEVL